MPKKKKTQNQLFEFIVVDKIDIASAASHDNQTSSARVSLPYIADRYRIVDTRDDHRTSHADHRRARDVPAAVSFLRTDHADRRTVLDALSVRIGVVANRIFLPGVEAANTLRGQDVDRPCVVLISVRRLVFWVASRSFLGDRRENGEVEAIPRRDAANVLVVDADESATLRVAIRDGL
jgi:hypothetical protein